MGRKRVKTEPVEPTTPLGKAGRSAKRFATRSIFNRDRLAIFTFGAEQVSSAKNSAWDAVRPQTFSKQEAVEGYNGRYPDGGAARFRELMGEHAVSSASLGEIERSHILTSRTFMGMGLVTLMCAFAIMNLSDLPAIILGGAGMGLFSLVMGAMAIKFDFTAWQVRNRRIAGFREYMENRSKRPGTGLAAAGTSQPPRPQ